MGVSDAFGFLILFEQRAFCGFDGNCLVTLIEETVQITDNFGDDLVFNLGKGVLELEPALLDSFLDGGVQELPADSDLTSCFGEGDVRIEGLELEPPGYIGSGGFTFLNAEGKVGVQRIRCLRGNGIPSFSSCESEGLRFPTA